MGYSLEQIDTGVSDIDSVEDQYSLDQLDSSIYFRK